jgi:hypothetical protein
MSDKTLQRLLREWAALVAILAMALGPLALAVSRSHGASDRIAIAAGLKPIALCLPGGLAGGDSGEPIADCGHCTPPQGFMLALPERALSPPPPIRMAFAQPPASRTAAFPRAPPARGPPAA